MLLTITADQHERSNSTKNSNNNTCSVVMKQPPQRSRSHSDDEFSVDTCSTASLSDSSSSGPDESSALSSSSSSLEVATTLEQQQQQQQPRRTRTRGKKSRKTNHSTKKNPKKQQQQQQQPSLPQLSPHEQDQYVAMDCEMVGVYDGHQSAVARVVIVNWHGQVLLDEYCHVPSDIVTDYRSQVSGIQPQHLEHARMDLQTLRQAVAATIQGKILIGHALKNDLQALCLTHDWQLCRDTAKYEPFMHLNPVLGRLGPRKLKELAAEYLHRVVQPNGVAHCPIQDAVTALDLYKLKRTKWEKVMEYKIQKTASMTQQPPQQ